MNRSRCSMGDISIQGIGQPPLANDSTGVTHAPGQMCYLCTRFVPNGHTALFNNAGGGGNTASGVFALFSNTTGNNNTASGANALESNSTGNLNTGIGFQALQGIAVGTNSTAIGAKALKKSLGTKNIGIGYQAGVTLQTGNNNIYIGNNGAGDESQTIRIGTAQAQTFIAGINTAIVSGTTVEIDTVTGQLGVVPSSARYKRDIETMASRSEGLLKLRPVTFVYKDDTSAAPRYGLIAEEVATVYPELVIRTATGEVQTVKYHELIPMLLNELQRLQMKVTALEALVGSRPEQ